MYLEVLKNKNSIYSAKKAMNQKKKKEIKVQNTENPKRQ